MSDGSRDDRNLWQKANVAERFLLVQVAILAVLGVWQLGELLDVAPWWVAAYVLPGTGIGVCLAIFMIETLYRRYRRR